MRSIELFAGAGGLAIGTSRAGFHHDTLIEWDHDACQTLRLNSHAGNTHAEDWNIIEGDVASLDFAQHHGRIDFISGGPPCQPFSLGGKHRGNQDDRNMFPQAVRAVREIQPKAFILENVRGLLRKNFANYYSYIIHQLRFPTVRPVGDEPWTSHLTRLEKLATGGKYDGPQYNVVYRLLNAADYGVPQHRWRVIIVGVRADQGIHFSFPEPTHEEDALLIDQWVTGDYWERHRVPRKRRPTMPGALSGRVSRLATLWSGVLRKPWLTVRDAISDLPELAVGESCATTPNHYLNPGAKSYAGHTGSDIDQPAKALKAGDHGVPGGENTLKLPDGSVRYFSVRECARIQTFPDQWVFAGSWTESMRQLGNAVPVQLAQVVAQRLHETMLKASHVGRKLAEAARRFPRTATKVNQRPPGV